MDKEIQKMLDDRLEFIKNNDLIDQDSNYAKHFKKVLRQLALKTKNNQPKKWLIFQHKSLMPKNERNIF